MINKTTKWKDNIRNNYTSIAAFRFIHSLTKLKVTTKHFSCLRVHYLRPRTHKKPPFGAHLCDVGWQAIERLERGDVIRSAFAIRSNRIAYGLHEKRVLQAFVLMLQLSGGSPACR